MALITKGVSTFVLVIAGLVAMGATGMAASLSDVGFKTIGITVGMLSEDAPATGDWVQEGRRVAQEESATQGAPAPVEPPAPTG